VAPRRLSDYPWVIVNLSCKLCSRRGRYRLVRLAARYGPEMELDRVLADLAHDCPYWRSRPRPYDPRCGARFEDLDRLRPQDLPPEEGVVRQRMPAREDVPQRRARNTPEPPGRAAMLSDWRSPEIIVVCDSCGRRETFATATVRAATIGDVRLTDLRLSLTADCPKVRAGKLTDWCGARMMDRDR
jgi:hypothetical protein